METSCLYCAGERKRAELRKKRKLSVIDPIGPGWIYVSYW